MKKYIANITIYDSKTGEYIDDFNEWRIASSEGEAISLFKEDYFGDKYDIIITEVYDI